MFSEGVPRETDKEKEFADFDIFDDAETPYSTFNFKYSNQAFKQLHDLMEFNTLNNIEVCFVPHSERNMLIQSLQNNIP